MLVLECFDNCHLCVYLKLSQLFDACVLNMLAQIVYNTQSPHTYDMRSACLYTQCLTLCLTLAPTAA